MKKLLVIICLLAFASPAFAEWGYDYHGHRTKTKNYWNDRDGDGVPNYYDRRDDNRNVW